MSTHVELEAILREEFLDDDVSPYKYSSAMIVRLLKEAEARACRCGSCELIYDDSLEVTIEADITEYALDAELLKLDRALWTSEDGITLLEKTTVDSLDSFEESWRRLDDGSPTRFFVKGRELVLDRAPTDDDVTQDSTLTLHCYREPNVSARTSPEIAERYHHQLCYWVAFRCLQRPDMEEPRAKLAEQNLQLFYQAFGPPVEAPTIEYMLESAGFYQPSTGNDYRDSLRSYGQDWVTELG